MSKEQILTTLTIVGSLFAVPVVIAVFFKWLVFVGRFFGITP